MLLKSMLTSPEDALLPDAASAARDAAIGEILAGLVRPQKGLPAKLFYDDEGCRLFGLITGLSEYYLTRSETALLGAHARAMAAHADPSSVLVEYGASDEAKAEYLLASGRFDAYVPIDIAPGALSALSERLEVSRPALEVLPLVADFMRPISLPSAVGDRPLFGFFPGSTIGNFDPEAVVGFLSRARASLTNGAHRPRLVIGFDLRKDPADLIPAYDDAAGVTAAFNRNMLVHVNRIADADFDPDSFVHEARWNDEAGRIEMHLRSRDARTVTVGGAPIRFEAGETIHTESSYKHTREGLLALAARAGWKSTEFWTDDAGRFGAHLLESASP